MHPAEDVAAAFSRRNVVFYRVPRENSVCGEALRLIGLPVSRFDLLNIIPGSTLQYLRSLAAKAPCLVYIADIHRVEAVMGYMFPYILSRFISEMPDGVRLLLSGTHTCLDHGLFRFVCPPPRPLRGCDRQLSLVPGHRGVALCGPPGTGKRLFALWVAHTLGVRVLDVSEARGAGPCVVFARAFDLSPEAERALTFLLENEEEATVIVACGRPGDLPPHLLCSGRLDLVLHTRLPSPQTIAEILRDALVVVQPHWPDLLGGMSGADVVRAAREVSLGRPMEEAAREIRESANNSLGFSYYT